MTSIQPANPYLYCTKCGSSITQFDNVSVNEGPLLLQPCGHRALRVDSYRDACPSWSPVDGCTCTEPHRLEIRA